MARGNDIYRDILSDRPDPFVVPFHTQWLELPQEQQVYTERAIDHVARTLRGEYKHPRKGRISPSMLGYCHRRGLFTYAGAPGLGEDPDSQDLMDVGTWDHLKWQAEGFSYPIDDPWMREAEKWIFDSGLSFGGSLDGLLRDGSMFELKTVYFSVMNKILDTMTPKIEHRMQIRGYRMLTGINANSLIYYERGTGNYYEFRDENLEGDHEACDKAEEEVNKLLDHISADTLPKMLPDCEMRVGTTYKQCQFRKICPKLHSITEAQQAGVKEAA